VIVLNLAKVRPDTFRIKLITRLKQENINMCIICAAIPATVAVGAKLNADQLHKPVEERKPVPKIKGFVTAILVATSIAYHTLIWRS
jgi:hypothetical protein